MTTSEIPVGTPVRYWPGAREGKGRESVTRSDVWSLGGHTPVVLVEGYAGGIALTHVEIIHLTCESCGDDFPADELGCGCDGHTRCQSCLIECPACLADLKDSMRSER